MTSQTEVPDQLDGEIHIRIQGEDEVSMSYMLFGEFNQMLRSSSEEMTKTLKRFAKNVQTKLQKRHQHAHKHDKKQQKKSSQETNIMDNSTTKEPDYEIVEKNTLQPIDINSLTNANFDNTMCIRVRDPFHVEKHSENGELLTSSSSAHKHLTFEVVINAPTITSLHTFPKSNYTVHCPIAPVVQMEFADDFRCMWYCESSPKSNQFVLVSREKVFVPLRQHIHCAVKLFVCGIRFTESSSIVGSYTCGRSFVTYLQHHVNDCTGHNGNVVLNRIVQLRSEFLQLPTSIDNANANDNYISNQLINDQSPSNIIANAFKDEIVDNDEQKLINAIHRNVYTHTIDINNNNNNKSSSSTNNTKKSLRVCCYNVLSDGYANLEKDKLDTSMYFYIKDMNYLNVEYRAQRVVYELIAYKADIIALQECDRKVFDQYLTPLLGLYGYTGHYTNKVSSVQEGCALFTRNKDVQLLAYIDVPYKRSLRVDDHLHNTLYSTRPDLIDIIGGKLGTVGQIAVVQVEDTAIVIGNTHLFYHPLASYIRLLQTQTLLRRMLEIEQTIMQWTVECGNNNEIDLLRSMLCREHDDEIEEVYLLKERSLERRLISHQCKESAIVNNGYDINYNVDTTTAVRRVGLMLMGDLNTTPDSGLAEYLNKGQLQSSTVGDMWQRLTYFYWGDNAADTASSSEEIEKQLDREQAQRRAAAMSAAEGPIGAEHFNTLPFTLMNATPTEVIGLSNYIAVFQAHLDYIFVSKDVLQVQTVAPMAPETVLQEQVALPNYAIPSDHVALLVDFELR